MPGWAGSSWYWMRYMDAQNETNFKRRGIKILGKRRFIHWRKRARNRTFIIFSFWNKFLKDRGFAPTEEPFKN